MGHNHEHDHEHIHSHGDHEHHHHHSHEHTHDHEEEGMSKDEKTLRILLAHWVKHNESHENDFKEWIIKAREMGKQEVADYIEKAIEYIDKANEMLIEAKKHM